MLIKINQHQILKLYNKILIFKIYSIYYKNKIFNFQKLLYIEKTLYKNKIIN